jgi:hypothetical protein
MSSSVEAYESAAMNSSSLLLSIVAKMVPSSSCDDVRASMETKPQLVEYSALTLYFVEVVKIRFSLLAFFFAALGV